MIGALIIVFREVIEAGLIVGIVLAVTRNVPHRGPYIWGGLVGGLAGAALVAAFAGAISNALSGMGQEIFNASILAIAVCMLAWHNIWMARHGRQMGEELRDMGAAVTSGARSLMALAIVVGVAVLREGAEVALFLYGIAISEGSTGWGMLLGGLIGLALGGGLSALTFAGLIAIPMRHLFRVTSVLIAFMAAGMAAQCVALLEQAGLVTKLSQIVWDSSGFVQDKSPFGKVLHTLFGYSDQPTLIQLIVYAATLAAIFGLMRMMTPQPKPLQKLATSRS